MLTHEKRILAAVIDIGIVMVIALLINILLPTSIFSGDITFLIVYFIVGFIYTSLCLVISKDKTIGLYSMSLRLLGNDWGQPGKKVILLRSITFGVLAIHIINILYMVLNKSETTLFDEISDSFIISSGDAYKIENSKENEN